MRRHDGGKPHVDQGLEGQEVVQGDVGVVALVHGDGDVRVGGNEAVAGEMFAAGGHAGILHALHEGMREPDHRLRVGVQGAVADHAGDAVIEVEHRREAEIDAVRAQFRGHDITDFARQRPGTLWMRIMDPPQRPHRRQTREALAETLHAPAFLIGRDQKRRRLERADLRGEAGKLCRALVIALKQDDAAHQRMREPPAVCIAERGAGHIQHQGAEHQLFSRIT